MGLHPSKVFIIKARLLADRAQGNNAMSTVALRMTED